MHPSDVALLASILATVILMPVLARFCVLYVAWTERRDSEAMSMACSMAERRAGLLLRETLAEQECHQLAEWGYLVVHSPSVEGRVYRVYPSRDRLVEVYQSGRLVAKLCVHPEGRLPASDVLLAHKLMIEGDEQRYLNEANVFGADLSHR